MFNLFELPQNVSSSERNVVCARNACALHTVHFVGGARAHSGPGAVLM